MGGEVAAASRLQARESLSVHRPSHPRTNRVPVAGTAFQGKTDPVVAFGSSIAKQQRRLRDTVWLDKGQTRGFKGVPEAVWNFYIGGYQVCQKWLKDRKGRTLSKNDIAHYQKIVVALSETIRLMKKIDEVIEEHGGWPGAFQSNAESSSPAKR